jgi:hypothetical protein
MEPLVCWAETGVEKRESKKNAGIIFFIVVSLG